VFNASYFGENIYQRVIEERSVLCVLDSLCPLVINGILVIVLESLLSLHAAHVKYEPSSKQRILAIPTI
jgi:hypothetical protein